MQKSNGYIVRMILLMIILIVGALIIYRSENSRTNDSTVGTPVACTEEAKLCPDGSYVGRTGPNCEFAACPANSIPAGWQTKTSETTNASVAFHYPADIGTTYIHTTDWPPTAALSEEPFSCTEAGDVNAQAGKTDLKTVGGHQYCVTEETGAAAGSIYHSYAYAFVQADKKIILTFSLQYPQCVNYDDPQRSACQAEEDSFNVDSLANQIAQTAKIN